MALFETQATRNGLELSAWVRKALRASIPPAELRRFTESTAKSPVIEAAFRAMDGLALVAPTPERRSSKVLKVSQQHSCEFFDATLPPNRTAVNCKGTCRSPRQSGRPCSWPAAAAINCTAFQSKRA
jgi:hypothetical protein